MATEMLTVDSFLSVAHRQEALKEARVLREWIKVMKLIF